MLIHKGTQKLFYRDHVLYIISVCNHFDCLNMYITFVIAFDVMCDVNLGNQKRSQHDAEFAVLKLNFNITVQPQGA